MSDRSYISVSQGTTAVLAISATTASNALCLGGALANTYAPKASPVFTGTISTPKLQLTSVDTCSTGNKSLFINTAGCIVSGTSSAGFAWTGSTANAVATYYNSTTAHAEPNLTFNGSALAFNGTAARYICMGVGNGTLCIYGAATNTTKAGDIKIEAGEGQTKTGGTVCIIAGGGDVYGRVALVQNYIERLSTTTSGVLVCGNVLFNSTASRSICMGNTTTSPACTLTIQGTCINATSGIGGILNICGGNSSGTSTACGGTINILGGCGCNTSTGAALGGCINIFGGDSYDGNNVAANCGGCITIRGGNAKCVSGSGSLGGSVNICGGTGTTGGQIVLLTNSQCAFVSLPNSYTKLQYQGVDKLCTTSSGIEVRGDIYLNNGANRLISIDSAASIRTLTLVGMGTTVDGGTGGDVWVCGGTGYGDASIGAGGNLRLMGGCTECPVDGQGGSGGNVYICGTANIQSGSFGGVYVQGGSVTLISALYPGVNLYYTGNTKLSTMIGGVCVCNCLRVVGKGAATYGICLASGCGAAAQGWVTVSDCRTKTDIVPITSALSKVIQLSGVCFSYCEDLTHKINMGLIAQSVLPILPEVVGCSIADESEIERGITGTSYGLSYGNITAVLIEAIKEQQIQICNLQNEINVLKGN